MRTKRMFGAIGFAFLATLGIVGALRYDPSERAGEPAATASPPTEPTQGIGLSASASWVKRYGSIAELTGDVALVVVGRVTGVSKSSPTPPARPADGVVFSDFDLAIEQVIKGARREREVIVVHQTGGTYGDGTRLELDDSPLLEVGGRYLLFLKRDPASDVYFVAGGPQGRFVVEGDRATSLSRQYPQRRIGDLGIEGVPLVDIAAEVRAAAP